MVLNQFNPIPAGSGGGGGVVKNTPPPPEFFAKYLKIGAGLRPAPTFQCIKFSFTHFQSFLVYFHAPGEIYDGAEILC